MMYVGCLLSLRPVEDLIHERGIDVCQETARYRRNRFGPVFAGEFEQRRVDRRNGLNWRWYLDGVFIRIHGNTCQCWRAVNHIGEVLEVRATRQRDRWAALEFLKRTTKDYDKPQSIAADRR